MKTLLKWLFGLIAGAAIAGLALVGALRGWFDLSEPADANVKKPTSQTASDAGVVRVELVRPAPRVSVQPAHVEPMERIEVVAKIIGYLQSLGKDIEGKEIDTGSRVKAGQVLANISVPETVLELQLKRAVLKETLAAIQAASKRRTQAEKDVGKYRAEMAYWDEELARYEDLYKRGSIEKSLLDGKRNLHKAAKAALESAEERVAQLLADLVLAEAREQTARHDADRVAEMVKYATIRLRSTVDEDSSARAGAAQANGQEKALFLVTRRWADPGTFIQPGTDPLRAAILSLARVDRMKVVVDVPELDSSRVMRGDRVLVQIAALPGHKFEGAVSRFSSALDPRTRTMRVEIDLPNPDGRLLYPNMYGSATLYLSERKGILTIPSQCVHKEGESRFIYCVALGQARKVSVAVGVDDGAQVEILNGLKGDSQVVRVAHGKLHEGGTVAVVESKAN